MIVYIKTLYFCYYNRVGGCSFWLSRHESPLLNKRLYYEVLCCGAPHQGGCNDLISNLRWCSPWFGRVSCINAQSGGKRWLVFANWVLWVRLSRFPMRIYCSPEAQATGFVLHTSSCVSEERIDLRQNALMYRLTDAVIEKCST